MHRDKRSPVLGGRLAWAVLTVGQFAAIVAVLQRSSLGVAATDAYARFGIAAATLATFTVVQLTVYAAMQVPVGVLIDRYGSKRLIIAGSLVMAGAQAMFAVAQSLPLAFTARMMLGIGDALTFISVMRLVPAWFPPQRSGKITMAVGPINQLGFIVSATVLAGGARGGRMDAVVPARRRNQRVRRRGGAGAAAGCAARPAGPGRARPGAGRRGARPPRGMGGAGHPAGVLAGFPVACSPR